MRALLALSLMIVATVGCGSEAEAPDGREPGTDAPTAAAEPSGPPPKIKGGPPPAWIETRGGSFWLAYSTFCWSTQSTSKEGVAMCADFIRPSCADDNIPQIVVERKEEVRFHLGFDAKDAYAYLVDGKTTEETTLESTREAVWVVNRDGAFALSVPAVGGNDATYAGCIRFRDDGSSSVVPAPGGALTIAEAVALGSGEPVLVTGFVIAPRGEPARLCDGERESYPPQCVEPSLVLRGLDLESVPGLKTAYGVSFTEAQVTLLGTIHGDVLAVGKTTLASSSG